MSTKTTFCCTKHEMIHYYKASDDADKVMVGTLSGAESEQALLGIFK